MQAPVYRPPLQLRIRGLVVCALATETFYRRILASQSNRQLVRPLPPVLLAGQDSREPTTQLQDQNIVPGRRCSSHRSQCMTKRRHRFCAFALPSLFLGGRFEAWSPHPTSCLNQKSLPVDTPGNEVGGTRRQLRTEFSENQLAPEFPANDAVPTSSVYIPP